MVLCNRKKMLEMGGLYVNHEAIRTGYMRPPLHFTKLLTHSEGLPIHLFCYHCQVGDFESNGTNVVALTFRGVS